MTLPRLSFGILFLAVVIFLSCVDCAPAKALKDPKEKKPELLKRNSQEKTPSEVKNKQTLLGRLSRFAEALLEILETILPKFIGDRLRKVVDRSGDKVCYDYVGCFSADDGATLPVSFPRDPKTVNASYSLYSRGNRDTPVLLDYTPTSSKASLIQFRMSKPLIIIVHGWQEDTSTRWVDDMKNAMLEKLDCNVICAHWGKSALLLNYIQSAGDTALVGREVSLLVQALLVSYPNTLSALQVHVIGYSLGAHIGGFFGRHFKGATGKIIGRISALDPAAALFDETSVALTKGDAEFVDVIHTSAGDRTLKQEFGILEPIGDVDFYPNGGRMQPGCALLSLDIGCSHTRSTLLYLESITNTDCHFNSSSCCGGFPAFLNQTCVPCGRPGEMGYHSKQAQGRGIQLLKTNSESQFCIR